MFIDLLPVPGLATCQIGLHDRALYIAESRKSMRTWSLASLLENECETNSSSSIESRTSFATDVIGSEMDVSIDSPAAKMVKSYGYLVTSDSIKTDSDRLLEKFYRNKIENKMLEKLIFENDAAVKAMHTCPLDMEK